MTEKEKTLLLSWVVNEQQRLDQEYLDTLQRIRFRKSDTVDYVEMLILSQRMQDFEEFARNMLRLLNLR